MSRIDDDLEARFRAGMRAFASPDVASLDARRHTRTRRIAAMRTGLALAVVGATVGMFIGARSIFGSSEVAPAAPSFDPRAYGTYVMTDVRLRRPDKDELIGESEPKRMFWVEYRAAWSGDEYPGVHNCRWSVLDASGREIGVTVGQLATMGSESRHVEVPIDGHPSDASAAQVSCDPARVDTPVAYDISAEEVVGTFKWRDDTDPGVLVRFQVGWPVELPDVPSQNWCTVQLFRATGEEVARQVFTLAVFPGPIKHRVWPDEFLDPSAVEDARHLVADVTCEPYTGQDEVGNGREPVAAQPDQTAVDQMLTSVDVAALRGQLDAVGWDAYVSAESERVEDWANAVGAYAMSPPQLADAMDALTRSFDDGPGGEDEFLYMRELSSRRWFLCGLLPAGHRYRGGEYCD
jgi:hypothetical protein